MREVPRGLVESKARQRIARTLMRSGPLTARGLMEDTGRSVACSHYHLRVLATAGAVRPFLKGAAKGDEVAYALSAEKLPEPARGVLLGEVSLQTCFRLAGILCFEGRQDVAELAERLGLSEHEISRHLRALGMEEWAAGTRRFGAGNRPDRLSDFDPEWFEGWFERPGEEDDQSGRREDGVE